MVSEGISMQYTTIIQVVSCLNSQDNCQKQFFYGHNFCHIMLKKSNVSGSQSFSYKLIIFFPLTIGYFRSGKSFVPAKNFILANDSEMASYE